MNNPEEAVETIIEILQEQKKLLTDIRNLLEDNTQTEKLSEEIHRLSSSVGQTKHNQQSQPGKKPLPTPTWFNENDEWICEKPEGSPKSTCKKCKDTIYWTLSKNGKKVPISEHINFPGKYAAHFNHCEHSNEIKEDTKQNTPEDHKELPF